MRKLTSNQNYLTLSLIMLLLAVIIIISLLNILANGLPPSQVDNNTGNISDARFVFSRRLIEEKFPEYKEWETQPAFAGKSISWKVASGNIYVAYITNGSGLPVVAAKCFYIDQASEVKEGPEFKQSTGMNFDPITCTLS
jgi:hypothetical protein